MMKPLITPDDRKKFEATAYLVALGILIHTRPDASPSASSDLAGKYARLAIEHMDEIEAAK